MKLCSDQSVRDLTQPFFPPFQFNRKKQRLLVGIHHRGRHRHHHHANHPIKVPEAAAINRMTVNMIDVAEALQETAINMNERLVGEGRIL